MTALKRSNQFPSVAAPCIPALVAVLLLWPAVSFAQALVVTQHTTLTADHYGPVIMAKDNVTLDCGSYRIIGDGQGRGVTIAGRSGVTVRFCHEPL